MMDCQHSLAPGNDELLRHALDGEPLSVHQSIHLAECPTCQQRFLGYQSLHRSLVSRLFRCLCPDSTRLNLYCANLLSQEDTSATARHVALCPLCAAEVAMTRMVLADSRP